MTDHSRYREAKRVTLIGAAMNMLLGFVKLIGGFFWHSHALVADGIHSFSDLFSDVMVLIASHYGSLDADDTHPYGHKRIETAATLLLSLLLILAGAGIAWDALDELIHKTHTKPAFYALPVALFSVIVNEILFHYTHFIGKKIRSELISANAWHHRSDAAASVVVTIGLIGSYFGFIYFDALAAVVVAVLIIKMGFEYGWNSVKELVDTAVDTQTLGTIETIIQGVDGVVKIHQLRSRLMGGDVFVDVHILVAPFISVSEGHYIAQHVHRALMKQLDHVKDVTVHVDPEDDEKNCPSLNLPNRKKLAAHFMNPLQKQFPEISEWLIHYLDGEIYLDIVTHNSEKQNQLAQATETMRSEFPQIKTIRLLTIAQRISHEQT